MNWKRILWRSLCVAGLSACGPLEAPTEAPAPSEAVSTTESELVVPGGLMGLHSPRMDQYSSLVTLFPNVSRRGYLLSEVFSTDNDWIPGVVNDTNRFAADGFKPVVRLDYARNGSIAPLGGTTNGATIPWGGSTGGRCLKRVATQGDVLTAEQTHKACYFNYIRSLVSQAPNVHTWVIGNEMNMVDEARGFPGGQIPAGDYAQLYREARALIRGLTGHTTDAVFVGGVSPNAATTNVSYKSGQQYLQDLLYTLQPNEVDGIAIHAYGGTPDPANPGGAMTIFRTGLPGGMGYQNQLRWIDTLGYSETPVMLTEFSAHVANGREDLVASFLRNATTDIHQWNGGTTNHDILGAIWFVWNYDSFAAESIARYSQVQTAFRDQQQLLPAGNPAGYGTCAAAPGGASRTFTETNQTVSGPFLDRWNQHGLGVYGFPVQSARCVKDSRTGRIIWSQWFQRHRMEWHPEFNGTALGAIGSQRSRDSGFNPDSWTPQARPAGTCELIGPVIGGVQQGKWVCGDFLTAWKAQGVGIYGFPVSPEFDYSGRSGVVRAQYFERARLERHLNPTRIEGGLLGCEAAGLVGLVLGC